MLRRGRTGLEMMRMLASGECSAAALARSRTMEALVLKRSGRVSRVMRSTDGDVSYRHGSCRACGGHRQG